MSRRLWCCNIFVEKEWYLDICINLPLSLTDYFIYTMIKYNTASIDIIYIKIVFAMKYISTVCFYVFSYIIFR